MPLSPYSAPRNVSAKGYFLFGPQPEWDERGTEVYQGIMGFTNFSLRPEFTNYTSPDNVGHAGPKESTPGLINLRGNINMTLGETLLGRFWEWILGGAPVTTAVAFSGSDGQISASLSFSSNRATIPTGMQPHELLAAADLDPLVAGQIRFTPGGSLATGDVVTINGEDAKDRDISEEITIGSTATDPHTSTKFFKTINSIVLTTAATTPVLTAVTVIPNRFKHAYTLSDELPGYRWIEAVYDKALITYQGVTPNNLTMNFGEVIEASIEFWGRRPFFDQNYQGGATPTARPAGWQRRQGKFQANFGTQFIIDDETFLTSTVDFALNQNFAENDIAFGSGSAYGPPPTRGDEPRSVTLGGRLNFDERARFNQKSFGEEVSARILYETIALGEGQVIHDFNFERCQFGESAVPVMEGAGNIPQNINLLPFAQDANNLEMSLEIYNGENAAAFLTPVA